MATTKKTKTMQLPKGGEYARVPERIKLFREECPNGLIETTPLIQEDGTIMFTARVVKDKSRKESAEATGHALGNKKDLKAFEKLETVAVGRALANLGYLASGEVASAEEMEEYYQFREEKKDAIKGKLRACESIDELKKTWLGLGSMMAEEDLVAVKDEMKEKLTTRTVEHEDS